MQPFEPQYLKDWERLQRWPFYEPPLTGGLGRIVPHDSPDKPLLSPAWACPRRERCSIIKAERCPFEYLTHTLYPLWKDCSLSAEETG